LLNLKRPSLTLIESVGQFNLKIQEKVYPYLLAEFLIS